MRSLCLVLALWLLPSWGWAQTCAFQQRFVHADGSAGCLTETLLASQRPLGYNQDLAQLLPSNGYYAVAASGGIGGVCPGVVGFAAEASSVAGAAMTSSVLARRRDAALASCSSALASARAPASCGCEVVLLDGRSPLVRNEFERRFAAPTNLAAMGPAEVAPPVPPPAAAPPAAPQATPSPTPQAVPVAPAPPAVVPQAGRHALVIGNNSYRHIPSLANAGADARVIGAALAEAGFAVSLHTDLEERAFKQVLRTFRAKVQPGDEVVLFFAGHGVQLGGSNFLLPADIRGESEEQVRDESLPLQRILDDMAERRAAFTLAIIDACRDNPFRTTMTRTLNARGLAPSMPASGQMIIYSAGTGQQALDKLSPADTDPNSLFTRVFLKEMRKPGITADRVLRNVRSEVVRLARSVGHQQTPALYDQAVGDFYFLPAAR